MRVHRRPKGRHIGREYVIAVPPDSLLDPRDEVVEGLLTHLSVEPASGVEIKYPTTRPRRTATTPVAPGRWEIVSRSARVSPGASKRAGNSDSRMRSPRCRAARSAAAASRCSAVKGVTSTCPIDDTNSIQSGR